MIKGRRRGAQVSHEVCPEQGHNIQGQPNETEALVIQLVHVMQTGLPWQVHASETTNQQGTRTTGRSTWA